MILHCFSSFLILPVFYRLHGASRAVFQVFSGVASSANAPRCLVSVIGNQKVKTAAPLPKASAARRKETSAHVESTGKCCKVHYSKATGAVKCKRLEAASTSIFTFALLAASLAGFVFFDLAGDARIPGLLMFLLKGPGFLTQTFFGGG